MKGLSKLFYLLILLLGVAFFVYFQKGQMEVLSFYGFSESNETEINYNYPVVLDQILVTPGQEVKQGDILLKLNRISSKETLSEEPYKIQELAAESKLWVQRKEDDLLRTKQEKQHESNERKRKVEELEKKLAYKKSLVDDLQSISVPQSSYNPIVDEIAILKKEMQEIEQKYDLEIVGINNELALGKNPYAQRVKLLKAEAQFQEDKKVREIIVTAPTDGLIGNVYCKEAEHIPSYKTLLSFYEPHSGLIRGFVHEDLTLEVALGDEFKVSSLKDSEVSYTGTVTGLGSRIVEIPTRLRKMPDIKTYGREVLISIAKDNSFLQKEKVAISNDRVH